MQPIQAIVKKNNSFILSDVNVRENNGNCGNTIGIK